MGALCFWNTGAYKHFVSASATSSPEGRCTILVSLRLIKSLLWYQRTSIYLERLVCPREFAISSAAVLSLCREVGRDRLRRVMSMSSERTQVMCSPVLLLDMYSTAQELVPTVLIRREHHEMGVPA